MQPVARRNDNRRKDTRRRASVCSGVRGYARLFHNCYTRPISLLCHPLSYRLFLMRPADKSITELRMEHRHQGHQAQVHFLQALLLRRVRNARRPIDRQHHLIVHQ